MRNGILLSLLMAVSMPAAAVYKCESQGHVTYADMPCGPKQTAMPSLPFLPPPADAAGAREQAANERRQLAAIAKSREAERVASEREQWRQKSDKAGLAHQRKCASLALEKKWSAEDAGSLPHTVSEKTQGLKKAARRKAERHAAECGASS
nr:DUF4124 domain-containing protein [uncultured Noviherbaspirillum sp.]